MESIFSEDKLIDENGEEHYIFTEYFYKGNKYYITKDKLIFKKDKDLYRKASSKLTNNILDEIINYKEPDIIDFKDTKGR